MLLGVLLASGIGITHGQTKPNKVTNNPTLSPTVAPTSPETTTFCLIPFEIYEADRAPLVIDSTANELECFNMCETYLVPPGSTSGACRYMTYNTDDQSCHLYDEIVALVSPSDPYTRSKVVSADITVSTCGDCYSENTAYLGDDVLVTIEGLPKITNCQRKCRTHHGCRYVSFQAPRSAEDTSICRLKSDISWDNKAYDIDLFMTATLDCNIDPNALVNVYGPDVLITDSPTTYVSESPTFEIPTYKPSHPPTKWTNPKEGEGLSGGQILAIVGVSVIGAVVVAVFLWWVICIYPQSDAERMAGHGGAGAEKTYTTTDQPNTHAGSEAGATVAP